MKRPWPKLENLLPVFCSASLPVSPLQDISAKFTQQFRFPYTIMLPNLILKTSFNYFIIENLTQFKKIGYGFKVIWRHCLSSALNQISLRSAHNLSHSLQLFSLLLKVELWNLAARYLTRYFTGNRKGQGNTILASSLTKVIVKITTPIYFSNTLGIPLVLRTHNLVNWFLRAYSFLAGFVKKIKAATHLTVFPFRTIQINDIIKQKLVSFHKTQINRSLETGATQRRSLVVETTETCNHCQTAPSQLAESDWWRKLRGKKLVHEDDGTEHSRQFFHIQNSVLAKATFYTTFDNSW